MHENRREQDEGKKQPEESSKVSIQPLDLTSIQETGEPLKIEYRPGKRCPRCKQGILDYDGLLNLVCPVCGPVQGGCFT